MLFNSSILSANQVCQTLLFLCCSCAALCCCCAMEECCFLCVWFWSSNEECYYAKLYSVLFIILKEFYSVLLFSKLLLWSIIWNVYQLNLIMRINQYILDELLRQYIWFSFIFICYVFWFYNFDFFFSILIPPTFYYLQFCSSSP